MGFRRWMACLGVVVLSGCGKPAVSIVPEKAAEPASAGTVSIPAGLPAATPVADQRQPSAAAPVVANIQKAPRRAPEGVFYLVRKVSVTSDSGVMSAHPGTRVTFVREENGKIIVNNGVMDIPVMQDHLTNDLDEVDAILETEAAGSIARRKAIESKKTAIIVEQTPANGFPADNTVSDISLGETFSRPAPITDAADLRRRRELAKMQALQDQINLLGAKIEADQNELRRIAEEMEYRRRHRLFFGRAPQHNVGISESKFVIEQRLTKLQNQQRALTMQLNALSQ